MLSGKNIFDVVKEAIEVKALAACVQQTLDQLCQGKPTAQDAGDFLNTLDKQLNPGPSGTAGSVNTCVCVCLSIYTFFAALLPYSNYCV